MSMGNNDNMGHIHLEDDQVEKYFTARWNQDPEMKSDITILQKRQDGKLEYLGYSQECAFPSQENDNIIVSVKMDAGWTAYPTDITNDERQKRHEHCEDYLTTKASEVLGTISKIFSDNNLPSNYAEQTSPNSDPISAQRVYHFEIPQEKFHQLMHCLRDVDRQINNKGYVRSNV